MQRLATRFALTSIVALAACNNSAISMNGRTPGQTKYTSAPFSGNGGARGASDSAGGAGAPSTPAANGNPTPTRTVEETDLYRLEGNTLYYLNSYRGLMVFDVTHVDQPKLLGRSAIYGDPIDMIVRNGIAIVVVGDWYGLADDGTPFHGSIVRGLDATDPTNIKVLGEARLGGWVRDDRVVGDVIYAVSEDYGWVYGWDTVGVASAGAGGGAAGGGVASPAGGGYNGPSVVVASVSFTGGKIQQVSQKNYMGWGGIFNVTPNAILLAHPAENTTDPKDPKPTGKTELLYLDISDPAGLIVERGRYSVNGQAQGWGADNGRWNLDFADGKTAHVVACATGSYYYCDGLSGYVLSTVDFAKPDAPTLRSELEIRSPGWSVAARFLPDRLYLSPLSSYGDGSSTPFQVFDLSDDKNPKLSGTVTIPGSVWNILPAPNQRMFALGNDWGAQQNGGSVVSLKYLDVTDPVNPKLLSNATFGEGWAWTPAAGTFKAFTMDATKGLVVLPFSGWDYKDGTYNNGLQLIQFNDASAKSAGAARTHGWVERGIFVQNRLVSLSDLSLSVVDYTDPSKPAVVTEITLARNVIASHPGTNTIAEISTDWWGNDLSSSEVRVLPLANADETADSQNALTAKLQGLGAQVFMNGDLAYVVTNVQAQGDCPGSPGAKCPHRSQQVQVVDLANGGLKLRGTVKLPDDQWYWYGWGWYGFWWYDWYNGAEAVQVGGNALAFRRWEPVYSPNGNYVDSNSKLYVVDLSNPDAPVLASTTVTEDANAWWGNMRVVADVLYVSHYEWYQRPGNNDSGVVQYFVDQIDLHDRAHPVIKQKINTPGLMIGGLPDDPTVLLFIDYNWNDQAKAATNDIAACRVHDDVCELLGKVTLDGWVGQTFVRGNKAYMSTELYYWNNNNGQGPQVNLHAVDFSDPSKPVDRVASGKSGWGWLLDVQGDRAVVSSGWGMNGVDIYQLTEGQAPTFRQFVRTQGWWVNGVSRLNDMLYLTSGYWGVQPVKLK